jgi:hypothetical protein
MKIIGKQKRGLQAFSQKVEYTNNTVYTKWGHIGIKIWKSQILATDLQYDKKDSNEFIKLKKFYWYSRPNAY